jgi:hypothetical protein
MTRKGIETHAGTTAATRPAGPRRLCRGDVFAEQGAERVHVATMLATMARRRAG